MFKNNCILPIWVLHMLQANQLTWGDIASKQKCNWGFYGKKYGTTCLEVRRNESFYESFFLIIFLRLFRAGEWVKREPMFWSDRLKVASTTFSAKRSEKLSRGSASTSMKSTENHEIENELGTALWKKNCSSHFDMFDFRLFSKSFNLGGGPHNTVDSILASRSAARVQFLVLPRFIDSGLLRESGHCKT